jgi:short-subunit dehydrogenase
MCSPRADEVKLIDLNVRSTVQLAKYVVRDMVERDRGRVLFTSSIASTVPGSFQAVYNASKSFVRSFALALRNEHRPARRGAWAPPSGPAPPPERGSSNKPSQEAADSLQHAAQQPEDPRQKATNGPAKAPKNSHLNSSSDSGGRVPKTSGSDT